MTPALLLPIVSIVIGGIVRALKSDGALPWNVPAKWRPWLAIALGLVVAAVDKVIGGATWADAGMVALSGGVAIVLHELGVESVRGGKEPAALSKPDEQS